MSSDGRWLIRFPDGANVSLRASSQDGFAYAEYVGVVGDDTLSVRVTEMPTAFEWSPAGAAALDAERTGATVVESTLTSVDGAPGARFTLADADSDTSGDTTEVLLVRIRRPAVPHRLRRWRRVVPRRRRRVHRLVPAPVTETRSVSACKTLGGHTR